jgi:hypothetical protein
MADEKEDPKSPYGQYTTADVVEVEAGHYFIQVGGDIFSFDGKMAFTRDRVEKLYDSIHGDLMAMKENGTNKQKEDAESCLLLLRIHPMRVH